MTDVRELEFPPVPDGVTARLLTCNEEMFTIRDAMRELNVIVRRIEEGEIEKAILMRKGKMVAAVVPLNEVLR